MANNVNNIGFTDFGAEQQAIARRQKLSEMLLQQGLTPIGPTETVGGWAIRRSPLEGIAKLAQAGVGAYGLNKSEAMQKVLAQKIRDDAAAQMSAMPQGTPAVPEQPQPALGGEGQPEGLQGPQMPIPAQSAQPPDQTALRNAYSRMLANPMLAQEGQKALEAMIVPPKADTIYKQTTPSADAIMRNQTSMQTHQTPSGSAILSNQGANDRFLGTSGNALLGAQTSMRGQDIGAQNAAAGRDVTMRGQNMADARSKDANALAGLGLSPDAKTNAAARYNIDGTLPPLGMGKAGAKMRQEILDEAAVMAGKSGSSGAEQRVQQIANKANTAAFSKLQQQETMVGAFEKNFNRNADMALEFSKKTDNTGVPIVNKWINVGKRSVTGDPQLAAYDASIKGVINEYTKIISGSMGNTQMAEQEIKRVSDLLTAAQTPAQVNSVIGMMKRETGNRMKGFAEEKAQLRESINPQRRSSDLTNIRSQADAILNGNR